MEIFEQSYGKNWQEIFAKYPKQVLYVDIWQDHCRPCLYEMEQSLFLQKQNLGDSIVFVFLYLGKGKKQWKSILAKQQIAGQHYIIRNSKNLEKWMEATKGSAAVPHYIIIGRNGEIFDKNAPFPDNEKWKGVMQKCLFQGQNR
jgi:thiol-disulfide isomerase/thioredoxin